MYIYVIYLIHIFIEQGRIKLTKSDGKHIQIYKRFKFQINYVLMNFL